MAREIRAQITTRSGPPGIRDAVPILQGEWKLSEGHAPRDFVERLQETLEAARFVAREGMVTEVAVLVYADALATSNDKPATT